MKNSTFLTLGVEALGVEDKKIITIIMARIRVSILFNSLSESLSFNQFYRILKIASALMISVSSINDF
jgi:hypothetical protein